MERQAMTNNGVTPPPANEAGERFWIDQRAGCIAIRDRSKNDDPDRQGLNDDMPDVVWYRSGSYVRTKCSACGHERCGEWQVSPGDVAEAMVECSRLNALAAGVKP